MKLVTPEIDGFRCRWANDDGMRLQDLTQNDDYDYVTYNEIGWSVGEGNITPERQPGEKVSRIVGKTAEGKPLYAYLLKKRLEYVQEDIAAKESARQVIEEQLHRSEAHPIEHMKGKMEIKR
jgi:hypothetical protein